MATLHPRRVKGKKALAVNRFSKINPFDSSRESELAWTWEAIKSGQIDPKRMALMNRKGIMDVTRFHVTIGIVSDPMHPQNNWRSAVTKVKIGNKEYFRLADAISIPAMKYWKAHGYPPPYEWAIFDSRANPARSSNPYPPTTRLHAAFNLASNWKTISDLLDNVSNLPGMSRRYASSVLHNLGNATRKQNHGRSHLEEKNVDGVKMVRAVPGPAKPSS